MMTNTTTTTATGSPLLDAPLTCPAPQRGPGDGRTGKGYAGAAMTIENVGIFIGIGKK